MWNVPFIAQSYLINTSIFNEEKKVYNFKPISYRDEPETESNEIAVHGKANDAQIDADMFLCARLRANGIFMFVNNLDTFGHLLVMDDYDSDYSYPEFNRISLNRAEWTRRYIHEKYSDALNEDGIIEQPCPDVYWFPIVSPRYCKDLIGIMETYGKWSGGKDNYKDDRVEGGYENVPTVDIHMKQVNLENEWLYFLKHFIKPMQMKIFTGYDHDVSLDSFFSISSEHIF